MPDTHYLISAERPSVVLAPMDGLTDAPMRAAHSEIGGYSYTVSEFLRVAQEMPPTRMFLRDIPELLNGAATPSGIPVQVQLLGGDPERMAASALTAVRAGARSIDINFGCPAPTVNRHDGGATLLKFPERIRDIVSAIRTALPPNIPVSAKLRLGWDSLDPIHENAKMAEQGGADWITIHGRTRVQRYLPPAFWEPIRDVRKELSIPVVANGDIWSIEDFRRCREITGCQHFMLGRGAIANPFLALQVSMELGIPVHSIKPYPDKSDWIGILGRLVFYSQFYGLASEHQTLCRLKQWLSMASRYGPFVGFDEVKRCTSIEDLFTGIGAPENLCQLNRNMSSAPLKHSITTTR